MGNRGTTPSWDEEESKKWGFFEHMRWINSRRRMLTRIGRDEILKEQLLPILRKFLALKKQENVR